LALRQALVTAKAPSPTVTSRADRCIDFSRNGWAFKDPRNFPQWLDVFSDPGIWLEFARRGLAPRSYRSLAASAAIPI